MSVTRTFTVTVVNTGGGNKYFIDGVQQATVNLAENFTYKFDVSDSSVGGHPFKFSTTSDGTHSGGSEYTTGVTSSGTAGQAGAYVQIVVAESAPTLYYYCQYHSGMGGQANTPDSDTWGLLPWNQNSWGQQGGTTVSLTGVSASTALGTPDAFPEQGWGRQQWGNSGWGVEYSAAPTGLSMTSSVGAVEAAAIVTTDLTGLSLTSSVGTPTLDLTSITALTGLELTSELGSFDNAGTLVGWGRNGWGEEPYGDSFNKLEQLAGVSATSSVGSLSLDLQSIVSPTGVSATSSVGSLSLVIDCTIVPTGVSNTSSVGSISPADVMGLTGLSATSSVGNISPADVVGLTGVGTTSSIGNVFQTSSPIIEPTGLSTTSSVGSIDIPDMQIGLTGLSTTSSVGSPIVSFTTDVLLTGVQATSSVNASGISFPGTYERLTPKTSAGYTRRTPKTSTGYTRKTPV